MICILLRIIKKNKKDALTVKLANDNKFFQGVIIKFLKNCNQIVCFLKFKKES